MVLTWGPFQDTGSLYSLAFNEAEASKLYQILMAVEHPGEGFDKKLNQNLMDQMMEMAPGVLDNLPMTNR